MVQPNVYSGAMPGPGPKGEVIGGFDKQGKKTVKPITFLGGTVTSFSAQLGIGPQEESSLNVELINDCFVNLDAEGKPNTQLTPEGEYFLGNIKIGAPVYFDLGEYTTFEKTRQAYEQEVKNGREFFKFGGILQSFTANQTSGGLTFSARVVDPRSLLGYVNIVVNQTVSGPVKHRNYYNAFAYWEYYASNPESREPEELNFRRLTTLDTTLQDPNDIVPNSYPNYVVQGNPLSEDERKKQADCRVWGSSQSNENGMLYAQVWKALFEMTPAGALGPLVYAPNYGEKFDQNAVTPREWTEIAKEKNWFHDRNVYQLDLSTIPDPGDVPSHYRISGPNISLLDLIAGACEISGKIFHVTLEPPTAREHKDNPQLADYPHVIRVHLQDIEKVLNTLEQEDDRIRSTIMSYNGKATDLSFGKELGSDNTRTLLLGEKKHTMIQSSQILPFFGEDKFGRAILPIYDNSKPNGQEEEHKVDPNDCGFKVKIYLDELQDSLRCPLYDYEPTPLNRDPEPDDISQNVVNPNRKVEITEYHIRTAMSSFERWKKYVFNPHNNEDISRIIRRNFPELILPFTGDLYRQLLLFRELTRAEEEEVDEFGNPVIPAPPDDEKEAVADAPANAAIDAVNNPTAREVAFLMKRRSEDLEKVYNWISQFARTYYGKQFAALIEKKLCVQPSRELNFEILARYNIRRAEEATDAYDPNDVILVRDPCTGEERYVFNELWQPKIYTHNPTNDGAWIEECGFVLGLGGNELGETYLSHFRTEDGRVGPIARFDSKMFNLLENETEETSDGIERANPKITTKSETQEAVFQPIAVKTPDPGDLDLSELEWIQAVCGGLDYSQWNYEDYITLIPLTKQVDENGNAIEDRKVMCPPPVSGTSVLNFVDLPRSIWANVSIGDKMYLDSWVADPEQSGEGEKDYEREAETGGCKTIKDKTYIKKRKNRPQGVPGSDKVWKWDCCGRLQDNNRDQDCFWDQYARNMSLDEYLLTPEGRDPCYYIEEIERDIVVCDYVVVPFTVDNPCFSRYCDDQNALEMLAAENEELMVNLAGILKNPEDEDDSTKSDSETARKKIATFNVEAGTFVIDSQMIPSSERFCYNPKPTGIAAVSASLDYSSTNNMVLHPSVVVPDGVAIPFVSNLETYGPWKSRGFDTSSGGVQVEQDTDFNPWLFSGEDKMNQFAEKYLRRKSYVKTEIETGSVRIPAFPDIPLGFIENGPNLTTITVSAGPNGVSTDYSFRTFTPSFGSLADLEKKALKDNASSIYKIRRVAREKARNRRLIELKTGKSLPPELNPRRTEQGTLTRILVGTSYPFGVNKHDTRIIRMEADQEIEITGGFIPVSTGDRVVVGGETLQKSVLELRYDYRKKAFVSMDALFSPVANIRPFVTGFTSGLEDEEVYVQSWHSGAFAAHYLPIYSRYLHGEHNSILNAPDGTVINQDSLFPFAGAVTNQARSISTAPNPPVIAVVSGKAPFEVNNLDITQHFLDPYMPNFGSGEHPQHFGSGAGHSIDIIGRGYRVPESGLINNFYTQKAWQNRFDRENRFLGLRGPLVLHQWGYDTQGKPIPNLIDDVNLIQKSGIFRTVDPFPDPLNFPYLSGNLTGIDPVTGNAYVSGVGLTDYFLRDWLSTPSSWPVGPVDLRFDRKRGVWVSPPEHKIVVVETTDDIGAYKTGSGVLINSRDGRDYNDPICGISGVSVTGLQPVVEIEDRIGREIDKGEQSYAYFDTFTSTYLLMGGAGANIKLGKFCNQWPSLSNVKDPKNAMKEVVIYQKNQCFDANNNKIDCDPWDYIPSTEIINGEKKPVVVQALNLFANVAAAEYQTKWCALLKSGGTYILLAAEC